MAITPSDFSKIWATNADTPEYTFSDADYLKGWDFVGNLPPTRAQWNAIQKSTDEKMKYVFDNFGAPLLANTVAEMTMQNRVYVYTGSETGYTAGHWYYYDTGTSAWVDGGVYNAMLVQTDKTLSISDEPADAKVTGDYIDSLNTQIQSIHNVAIGGALVEGTARDTSVKIGACTFELNGTTSGFMILSLQEKPLKAYTSSANFTDNCTVSNTLLAGHTYKLHAILVGGTITDSYGTYKPGFTIDTNVRLYGYADGHNTSSAVLSGNNTTITPETDTVVGTLVYLVVRGVIFNHAIITAYIEDVTLTSKLDTTDKTLSIEGLPADAKRTGDVITSLKNLTVKTVSLPYTWEHGGISTGGEPSSDNKRVRTQAVWIDPTVSNILVCDPSVQVRILYFNEPIIRHAYFVKINDGWTNGTQQLEGGYYAALVARYTNSSSTEITDLTPFASLVKVEKETAIVNDYSEFKNKKVAIIGDSISTNGNYSASNPLGNVPEIIITEDDVGVNLSAYATYYDIGTTVGGHTITADDVGTEITFTPVTEDIGKMVGVPKNNNAASVVVWWEVLKNELGIEPIPVAWSGSSITSHEATDAELKTSYAWHPAQIRKCGIRVDGSMERIAPDIVIIYRGTNDFSHQPYARLTPNYFDQYPCTIPETDYDSENNIYGYIEGLCLTIQKIKEAYPKAQIFLATLNFIKRVSYSNFPTRNGYNTVPQYNNAIRATADYFGLPIIDFAKDGLDFWNANNEYYQDGTAYTHPTTKGHAVLAQRALKDIVNGYVDINV